MARRLGRRYVMASPRVALPTAAAVTLAFLLAVASWQSVAPVQAQGADASGGLPGIVGTWFLSVPLGGPGSGLTGFVTYDHSGTVTETVSNMFGGPPSPGGALTLNGTDRGVWRQVPGGFEVLGYRMVFSPGTGAAIGIIRIRARVHFAGDRDHLAGTFLVAQWICPTPLTCPDPTRDAPDVPEFVPPENTYTQSRVKFPQ
jgi:hypothetical protein